MKKRRCVSLIFCAVLIFSFVLVSTDGYACTGIRIKTQDGNYIFSRTLEFADSFMPHEIIAVPRNYKYTGRTPYGKPGMTWQTKYAFVGFSPTGMMLADDGLNEKGLACGGFMFPGYAQYEDVSEKDYPSTISCMELISWILGNCASVAEVREQLPKIHVCGIVMPQLGSVAPMHLMVSDKTGDSIIIEPIAGKLNIYDNKVNVITNAPVYEWHTENLRNYIALKPENNPAININGYEFAQFGQGSGLIGIPGDFSSPSRFVRAAYLVNSAFQGKNVDEGIGIAFHIMNHFDIPLGAVRGMEGNTPVYDTAQWTSASDMTNARYFYHTYNDRSVRMIDLMKLDLNAPDIKTIKDVQKPGEAEDVSGEFKQFTRPVQ